MLSVRNLSSASDNMATQRVLPQSKETLLQNYNKRLKDDIRSILDNFTEIIKTAKVGLCDTLCFNYILTQELMLWETATFTFFSWKILITAVCLGFFFFYPQTEICVFVIIHDASLTQTVIHIIHNSAQTQNNAKNICSAISFRYFSSNGKQSWQHFSVCTLITRRCVNSQSDLGGHFWFINN